MFIFKIFTHLFGLQSSLFEVYKMF